MVALPCVTHVSAQPLGRLLTVTTAQEFASDSKRIDLAPPVIITPVDMPSHTGTSPTLHTAAVGGGGSGTPSPQHANRGNESKDESSCIFTCSLQHRTVHGPRGAVHDLGMSFTDERLQQVHHYVLMCDDLLDVQVRAGVVGVTLRPGSSISLLRLSAKKLAAAPGQGMVMRQDLYMFVSSARHDPCMCTPRWM